MMKKFELCYDIEPDKSFLIPDLLPKDEPFTGDQEWNGALAFQYHYNVLPSSHHHALHRAHERLHPQNGLALGRGT